ncbi:MAG TPA: DUF2478 domain-containing protein [Beijerinckiaceae bacterium]|nr:DUF2478 domain-containing protein [Beijerinckiaceae bacterium]
MRSSSLAAVLYREGASCDALLADVARQLAGEGYRLAGAVQTNDRYDALCACDMTLSDLNSGRSIRISQRLGQYARGCRLDPGAMAEVVSLVEAGLAGGADLLILNKFGKSEAAGHGFRPAIAEAVLQGIPVLVGVSAANLPAWMEFTGGEADVLEPDAAAILAWIGDPPPPIRASA